MNAINVIYELKKYLLTEIKIDQNIEKESIEPDEDILSLGIIDSLALLKLTKFIEKKFAIKITDEDLEIDNFSTLNNIKKFIESKQQGKK
jgi:acyl carrier protein